MNGFLEVVHFELLYAGYNEDGTITLTTMIMFAMYRQLWAVVNELGTCMKRARMVSEEKKGG